MTSTWMELSMTSSEFYEIAKSFEQGLKEGVYYGSSSEREDSSRGEGIHDGDGEHSPDILLTFSYHIDVDDVQKKTAMMQQIQSIVDQYKPVFIEDDEA